MNRDNGATPQTQVPARDLSHHPPAQAKRMLPFVNSLRSHTIQIDLESGRIEFYLLNARQTPPDPLSQHDGEEERQRRDAKRCTGFAKVPTYCAGG